MAPAVATYAPRAPSRTVLSNVIAEPLETLLASLDDEPNAKGLPDYGQRAFDAYLPCGILAQVLLRLGCESTRRTSPHLTSCSAFLLVIPVEQTWLKGILRGGLMWIESNTTSDGEALGQ